MFLQVHKDTHKQAGDYIAKTIGSSDVKKKLSPVWNTGVYVFFMIHFSFYLIQNSKSLEKGHYCDIVMDFHKETN